MTLQPLLSDTLRPRTFSDLTLPQKDINYLEQMVASRAIVNLLFYGPIGSGKTEAARLVMSRLAPQSSLEIDGSMLTGVEFVRQKIDPYASGGSVVSDIKICFLDQADLAFKRAQGSLLKVVENAHLTRFIFATTDCSKLIPALRSRLLPFCFDVSASDQGEVQARLLQRYQRVFCETGIPYDEHRVQQVVLAHYPDLRRIANHLEYEFAAPARPRQQELSGDNA